MTLVTVKKLQLQKDSTSTRSKFVMDKIKPLHLPTKVWTNPSWPLPTNDEIVEVDGVEYDETEVIKLLDKAGADLKSLIPLSKKEEDAKVALADATQARKDAPSGPKKVAAKAVEDKAKKSKVKATEDKNNAKMKIETELGITLHEFLKDLPRKVLFDNAFWFYLFWKSPIYGVHRYDTWDTTENQLKSEVRMYGGWTRASISAAYLSYYLANECGITDTDYREKKCGARLRMWILDESPLISEQLRKSFLSAVISGKNLDDTWDALFQKLGAVDVDALTQAQVDTLIASL
jgi:hypothetical protein